jgi:hypothetical protein
MPDCSDPAPLRSGGRQIYINRGTKKTHAMILTHAMSFLIGVQLVRASVSKEVFPVAYPINGVSNVASESVISFWVSSCSISFPEK